MKARRTPGSTRPAPAAVESGDASFHLRTAKAEDLDAINRVVVEATTSWGLPARVHRLATPALTYDAIDLAHMTIVLLGDSNRGGIGIAAWEEASRHQAPDHCRAVLLHGLYVVPRYQRMGLGKELSGFVLEWADQRGFDGVVVRAWRDALPFFRSIGFAPFTDAGQADRDPRQLWKPVQASSRHRSAQSARTKRTISVREYGSR